MERILVIGGARFVGPHLLDLLSSENNNEITVFNRGKHNTEYEKARFIKGDRDDGFEELEKESFDTVFDMCAYNGAQTKTAIEKLNFDFFVHFGTVASYAEPVTYPIKEDAEIGDWFWGDYAAGKKECETVLANSNVKYASLRPTYILGAENYVNRENFIYKKLLNSETLKIPGDGQALIQFVFVDEVAKCLYLLGKNKIAGTYNCVNDDYITLTSLVKQMGKISQTVPCIEFDPQNDRGSWNDEIFPFANENFIFDNSKIKGAVDITFAPLIERLEKDWNDYYKNNLN